MFKQNLTLRVAVASMLKSTVMQSSMKMVLLKSEAGQIFNVGADDGYRRSPGRAKHLTITGEMTLQ